MRQTPTFSLRKHRSRAAFAILLAAPALSGCGGSGTSPDSNADGPLQGPATALVSAEMEDALIDDPVDPSEYSEDAVGRRIRRTGVKIVFTDQATIGEANEVLTEFSAQIVASLRGYPAVVIRIPDPGTLQGLETVVADMKARGPVKSVLKSYATVRRALPPNIHHEIFNKEPNNSDPENAPEWEAVRQHAAVRGAAAWHLKALAQEPLMVVGDGFGDGNPSTTLFDIDLIPGEADFGVKAGGPPEPHGYQMLSIIAARHADPIDEEKGFLDPHWASGMVPVGVKFAAVDDIGVDPNAIVVDLIQTLAAVAGSNSGTIIVNLSVGESCSGIAPTDPCLTQQELNERVVDFIAMVRLAGLEERVLFVSSAGNVGSDAPVGGPTDAQSSSIYNAAGLLDGWFDPLNDEAVARLTNVMVVENVAPGSAGPPFEPGCVLGQNFDGGSFIGGQIGGIGAAFSIAGSGETPSVNADSAAVGGTSSATAQISGIAAYVSGIRPDFSPQDLIRILVKTGEEPSGLIIANCSDQSSAPVADAYAAILATDPPGQMDNFNARARLELLDVASDLVPIDEANPIPAVNPDTAFDIRDLRRWIDVLTGPGENEIDHGRFDLNGDGRVGGDGRERFDLDISMNPFSTSSVQFSEVDYEFIDTPVTYDENELTDLEIVCYYAMSPLYEIGGLDPFTAEGRAEELERVRELCDPCAASTESANQTASKQLDPGDPDPRCEEVSVTVDPERVTIAPGGTVRFTATVTGLEVTDVNWSATGGTIDANGLYTAGDEQGDFQVTATSVDDPSLTATAIVSIVDSQECFSGGYFGTITQTNSDGTTDTIENVQATISTCSPSQQGPGFILTYGPSQFENRDDTLMGTHEEFFGSLAYSLNGTRLDQFDITDLRGSATADTMTFTAMCPGPGLCPGSGVLKNPIQFTGTCNQVPTCGVQRR